MERADLVEAQWESKGIQSTFIVSFDYSSLVTLELLSRQEERMKDDTDFSPIIEGVLLINGGYFTDAHSHPLMTTPALRSPLGGMVTWFGQRSRFMARQLLKSMFSKEYKLSSLEFNEIYEAISRHNGFPFVSKAAGFVAEHRSNYGERWDLRRLYLALSLVSVAYLYLSVLNFENLPTVSLECRWEEIQVLRASRVPLAEGLRTCPRTGQ